MTALEQKCQWVIDWLKQHTEASTVNTDFVLAFREKFPCKPWTVEQNIRQVFRKLLLDDKVVLRKVSLGDMAGERRAGQIHSFSLKK